MEPRRQTMAVGSDSVESAHFHHVHLNVTNPSATIKFYKEFLGAIDVRYRGMADALFTERSFILLTKVAEPPPIKPAGTLTHIGWAGVDGPNEYEWLRSSGVRFQTPVSPLGPAHYMYFYGPDNEILEIYTGEKSHRFNHFHLFCADVNETAQWYAKHLGLEPTRENVPRPTTATPENLGGIWMNSIRVDNVNIVIFGRPEGAGAGYWPKEMAEDFETTDGGPIDHVAFSLRDIAPAYERMATAGVEIVRPMEESDQFGHKSFCVRAPDKLLVEIVEDKPIPEGIWE